MARRWSRPWQLALAANFGSFERWREEFVAMGKALGGGSGWVLLTFQPREGTLVNQWAADHTHALAGGVPILALDMYEHSYHMDFGAAAGAYVDAFMDNIDWAKVLRALPGGGACRERALRRAQDDWPVHVLLDVRRAGVFEQATDDDSRRAVARSRAVARVVSELPADREVDRLLRLRPRGRPRDRAAPSCRGNRGAFPARRHRRLALVRMRVVRVRHVRVRVMPRVVTVEMTV